MRMRALSSAPAAVRMRLHRKRRREGTHYVCIPLASFEIDGLIRLKVLPKAHREDADALQAAVLVQTNLGETKKVSPEHVLFDSYDLFDSFFFVELPEPVRGCLLYASNVVG